MVQDLNSPDIDGLSICNLALESCALAAETNFKNIDLVTRAIAYCLEALEIEPDYYQSHLALGLLLLGCQVYQEAIKFLQNAYDMKPSADIEMYLEIAESEMQNFLRSKADSAVSKKKNTVDGILDMTNKFKI